MKYVSPNTGHNWKNKILPGAVSVLAALGLIYGIALFAISNLEQFAIPVMAVLLASIMALFFYVRYVLKQLDRDLIVTSAACMFSITAVMLLPAVIPPNPDQYHVFKGIYLSFIEAGLIVSICLPALCSALYRVFGSTPQAYDLSRYPILILPIIVVLAAYSIILFTVIAGGLPKISWELLSTSYSPQMNLHGILNPILGTFMLMALTSIIALPVGVGAGIYMSEYGGRIAGLINFCTTLLRSMSVVVIGLAVFAIGVLSRDTNLDGILTYPSVNVRGTFLLASIFMALLVIPIIAKATEEGMRSLPRDLREGSLALGATEGYTLLNVLLPWSIPSILTGLLLGCAEAAGSVTVIVLVGGWGQSGFSPFSEVTSLAFMIFRASYSPSRIDTNVMGQYRYAAALILLIITLGLTVAYLILRNRFAERYRTH